MAVHGLLQKDQLDATSLEYHIREAEDGWRLSIREQDAWIYIGKFTRKRDVELFLQAYLPQPD